jgi:hypothetical protein
MPKVEEGLAEDRSFGGPLTTTFLLAVATPMVVLPIERIFKPSDGRVGAGDDGELYEGLSERVSDALGNGRGFADAPFFSPGKWSTADSKPFNIAQQRDAALLKRLGSAEAHKAAEIAPQKES